MKKSRGIVTLICTLLLLAGCIYTAIFGVGQDKSGSAESIKLGLDLAGGVSITYQVVGDEEPSATDMSDTIFKLQQRVQNYSTEALVYKEGSDRINIEIPGVTDANQILQDLGRPGSLYFIMETDSEGNKNYTSTYAQAEDGSVVSIYSLTKSLDELKADGSIVLTGSEVADAQAGYRKDDMNNQTPIVQLTFNAEGTTKFAEATKKAYEAAPQSVNNFISLINKNFYDGLIFHRVIKGFMIQGGDPEGTGMGGPGYSIKGEFASNGFKNDLKHTEGVLSMARSMFPDSAGSQFFVMHKTSPHLDGDYAAFGKVTEGMDVVNRIAEVDTDFNDKPRTPQVMRSVTVETFGVDYPEPDKL